MAAFALGLGSSAASPAAVDRLLASLQDSDEQVRGRAAEALGKIGDPRAALPIARLVVDALPKTIDRMTVRGDDPGDVSAQWGEQRLALFALARLKDVEAARLALLGRRPAALRLVGGHLGRDAAREPGARAAAPGRGRLRRAAPARARGARAGRAQGPGPRPSAWRRSRRTRPDGRDARAAGARRDLGDARGARRRRPHSSTRRATSCAARRCARWRRSDGDRALGERLVRLVASRDPWIRAAALGALARSDRESFALVLSGMDPDRVFWVRSALATRARRRRATT